MPDTDPNAPEAGEGQKQTFTQEDVDRIIADRLKRENLKELKAAATELAELKRSNQSDTEKLNARLASLEAETNAAKADAMRLRIAARFKVSDEDADLFLTGADEDTLTAQAKRLAQRADDAKKRGGVVPGEGTTNHTNGTDPIREFTRGLFQQAQE